MLHQPQYSFIVQHVSRFDNQRVWLWPGRMSRSTLLAGVVVVLLVAVFFNLVRSVPASVSDPVFTSPRQSVTWAMAEAWRDTGRPAIVEPRLTSLPNGLGPALTPRDGASRDVEILPKDFPLTVVAYAAALRIHPLAAHLLNPISGMLLLGACAGLARELGASRRAVLFSALFLTATISFWNNSSAPVVVDTAGAAALLGATALLLRSRRAPRWAVLAGLLLGLAVSSRYTHIGPSLVLLGALAIFRRVGWQVVVYALVGLSAGLAAILFYHQWLYGAPLTTGYGLGDTLFADRLRFEGRGLLSFNFSRFRSHARLYLLRPESLLLFGFAIYGAAKSWKLADARAVIVASGVIFAALFVYHGGQGTFGSNTFAVNASFVRYFLPVFALCSVFAGIALDRLDGDKLTAGLGALALAIASVVWTTSTGPGGIESARRQMENQREDRAEIVAVTPEDALIITRLGSKTIFPVRGVLSATLTLDGSRVITDREVLVWEVVPEPDELVRSLLAMAAETDHPVFVQNDGRTPWLSDDDLAEIAVLLDEAGLRLVPVGEPTLQLLALRPT